MSRLRLVVVLGVVVVGVVGAAATAYVVKDDAKGALTGVLAVQGGVVVALAITAWALLSPTVARLDDLVEALRAFARGERHTRVNPADFAGLADVARAVNDVGASMCENDDPNLGPVHKKTRDKPLKRPSSDAPRPSQAAGTAKRPSLDDAGVGEVRRHEEPQPSPAKVNDGDVGEPRATRASGIDVVIDTVPPAKGAREPAGADARPVDHPSTSEIDSTPPTEPPRPITAAEGVSEPRVSRKSRRKAKRAAALASQPDGAPVGADDRADASGEHAVITAASDAGVTASTSDPAIAAPATEAVSENPTVVESAPPVELPSRDELRALFDEFRREKRGAGQADSVDLEFDAFADTILSESERLVAEHQCRGVRFEVAVAEGEVSLRPRLIR